MKTRVIGNDEGDTYCDICEQKDWWQAVELTNESGLRSVVCTKKYDGPSCAERIAEALR